MDPSFHSSHPLSRLLPLLLPLLSHITLPHTSHTPQLYVPRIPGVPEYDDALVPEKWDFQGEVSSRSVLTQSLCHVLRGGGEGVGSGEGGDTLVPEKLKR